MNRFGAAEQSDVRPSAPAAKVQLQQAARTLARHTEAPTDVPGDQEVDTSNEEPLPIIKELTSICTDTIVSATAKMKALKARQAAAYSKTHSRGALCFW